jgi:hypothetical protein
LLYLNDGDTATTKECPALTEKLSHPKSGYLHQSVYKCLVPEPLAVLRFQDLVVVRSAACNSSENFALSDWLPLAIFINTEISPSPAQIKFIINCLRSGRWSLLYRHILHRHETKSNPGVLSRFLPQIVARPQG